MITAELRKFEDRVVAWLLKHYGIYDTRTRFMLLDLEEDYFGDDGLPCVQNGYSHIRKLSLRAFHHFFPEFPVPLTASCQSKTQWAGLSFAKVMTKLESTFLGRCYDRRLKPRGRADHPIPFAVIHKVPYHRSAATSVVLHNCAPIDPRIAGPHFVYQFKTGGMCFLETLEGFLAGVDLKRPKSEWLASEINKEFLDPVPVQQ